MQIYVVRQNDTLSRIARSFGTTAEDIAEANELPNPNNLVIGQALVIPIIGKFLLGASQVIIFGLFQEDFKFLINN